MLENLNDLKRYADALAKRVPSIASRVRIGEPGLSIEDLSKLSTLDIPPIYARCISTIDLFGVAIGYFSMWPGSIKASHMVDALLYASKGDFLGAQEARNFNLLVVAQEEANLVCVGRYSSKSPDAVYYVDVMRSPTVELQTVAVDFEKFLLLAGNLHEIGRKYGGEKAEATSKMVECCQYFGCAADQISFWTSRAEALVA